MDSNCELGWGYPECSDVESATQTFLAAGDGSPDDERLGTG